MSNFTLPNLNLAPYYYLTSPHLPTSIIFTCKTVLILHQFIFNFLFFFQNRFSELQYFSYSKVQFIWRRLRTKKYIFCDLYLCFYQFFMIVLFSLKELTLWLLSRENNFFLVIQVNLDKFTEMKEKEEKIKKLRADLTSIKIKVRDCDNYTLPLFSS